VDLMTRPAPHSDCWRSLSLEPQPIKGELALVDAPEQFNASDRDGGRCEVLEPEHRPGSELDAAMVLVNQVVQIL